MPTIAIKDSLPRSSFTFHALDIDGLSDLPSDWYLRICGTASHALKGGPVDDTLPRKKLLVDYWHSRPTADELIGVEKASSSMSASASSSSTMAESSSNVVHDEQVAKAFALVPERDDDEPPPPAYSLMSPDESPSSNPTPVANTGADRPGAQASSVGASAITMSPQATNASLPSSSNQEGLDEITSMMSSASVSTGGAGALGHSTYPVTGSLNAAPSVSSSSSYQGKMQLCSSECRIVS